MEGPAAGFPSVVPRAAAAASPGTRGKHVLRPLRDSLNRKVWAWAQRSGRLGREGGRHSKCGTRWTAGLRESPGASRASRPAPPDRAGCGRARGRAPPLPAPGPGAPRGINLSAGAAGRAARGSRPDAAAGLARGQVARVAISAAAAAPRRKERGGGVCTQRPQIGMNRGARGGA